MKTGDILCKVLRINNALARRCTVAQYAVFEANAMKLVGASKIRTTTLPNHGRRSYGSWGDMTPTFRAKAYRGHNLGIIRSARRICPPPHF